MLSKATTSEKIRIDQQPAICNSASNRNGLISSASESRDKRQPVADFKDFPKSERLTLGPHFTNVERIFRETEMRLDTYSRRVREGVEVLPASDFARWLQFSGILELLEAHEMAVPLRVESLRVKTTDLLFECGEWFRLHERSNTPRDPLVPRCELERITARLTQIEQALRLSPPLTENTASVAEPADAVLRVIRGGA